jgi:hypothetical protein
MNAPAEWKASPREAHASCRIRALFARVRVSEVCRRGDILLAFRPGFALHDGTARMERNASLKRRDARRERAINQWLGDPFGVQRKANAQ